MKLKTLILTGLILTGLLGTGIAAQATAAIITIDDANYSRLFDTDHDGSGNSIQDHLVQVGTKGISTGYQVHGGYAFQMTGATAGSLQAADFSVTYTGITEASGAGTVTWNVDIYATRVSSSSAFLASDYENGTLLMEDFVTTSSTAGLKSLDATGQANLLSYLQSNWVAGDYLFITLKSDPLTLTNFDANNHHNFSSDAPSWSGEKSDALLTVTAIPEPTTLALAILGLISLGITRRRKPR